MTCLQSHVRGRENLHGLHELIDVPPVLGANRHRVGNPVQQIQLLDADRIDLVQHVDNRDVTPALRLQHVNNVVDRRVAPNHDIRRRNLVLAHDGLDLIVVDVRQRHGAGDVEAALVLLLERDVGGLLVDADAEALELRLDDALVRQGLIDVEDDEDEVARLGDGDDLATTAATVLGAFDNSGEIDDLEGCTYAGVRSGFRKVAVPQSFGHALESSLTQQRLLARLFVGSMGEVRGESLKPRPPSQISSLLHATVVHSTKSELTIIDDLARHGRQGRELVRRRLGMLPRQPAHQRTLPHRGEPDEADTRNTRPRDVEPRATAAAAARGRQELTLQLRELGF